MGAAPIKMFEHVWTPKPVMDKKIKATKLAVFDFDSCLFRTPNRPSWWPFNSYETMMESLNEPVVSQSPTKEWFDPEVMARLAELSAQEDVWKVLVTFRAKPFSGRILEILSSAGISFDEVRCRPLCSCCNPLGMSQTGSAGYGDLKIARNPTNPEDRHRLVHTANLVSEMPKVRRTSQPTRPPNFLGLLWLPVPSIATCFNVIAVAPVSRLPLALSHIIPVTPPPPPFVSP
jgi:hypothetical protein